MKTNSAIVYVGVDVSKATLQVHRQNCQTELLNGPAGFRKLCQQLKNSPASQVILEATGGYEQGLVDALHKAKIPVSVVNPAQVRASAQAKGERAKTDRIDAAMLSDYGQRYTPESTPPATRTQRKLAALTQWLKQLIAQQSVAKTYAEHHQDRFVQKQHQALLDYYHTQIKEVEDQLAALCRKDHDLGRRVQALDAIEGVGTRTALLVLAHMPELGFLNRQETAALAGLAPWTRDSGTLKGIRCIGGGRAQVRLALYMAALCAMRCNPVLKTFYQNLIARGKLPKVALTAVMRRLLVYMNHQLKLLATPAGPKLNDPKQKDSK